MSCMHDTINYISELCIFDCVNHSQYGGWTILKKRSACQLKALGQINIQHTHVHTVLYCDFQIIFLSFPLRTFFWVLRVGDSEEGRTSYFKYPPLWGRGCF